MLRTNIATAQDASADFPWVYSGRCYHGAAIVYRFERTRTCDVCADCADGVCLQRVEACAAWSQDHIVHGMQRADADGLN